MSPARNGKKPAKNSRGGEREGAGRPPKPPGEVRKNLVVVRVTDDELAAWEGKAQASDLTLSEWLREAGNRSR